MRGRLARGSVIFALQGWLALAATASDGVIEFNQASAVAGSVTPGDAPGYPVTLSRGGSYRLTGNLDSPIASGAVEITAPMVTLDLGGFMVSSTNACSGYPTTSCTTTFGTPGISSTGGAFLVVIRNGVVTGMGGSCISLAGPSSEIDQLRVFSCGGIGLFLQNGASHVTRSFAGSNLRAGIDVSDGSQVEDCEVRANGQDGIHTSGSRLPVVLARNRIFDNLGFGVNDGGQPSGLTIITRNVFSSNTVLPFFTPASYGDNRCHNAFC